MSPQKYNRRNPKRIPITSTPNDISDGLSIKRSNKSFSPIFNHDQEYDSESSSSSSAVIDNFESNPLSYMKTKNLLERNALISEPERDKFSKCLTPTVILTVIGILFTYVYAGNLSNNMENCDFISIKEIQEKFPTQPQYTFDAIVSGVNEVKLFDKPSMFIFLYESKTRQTIDKFVQVVARYACTVLNDDCKVNPIILTSSSFNTVKAKTDYGDIITTYKPLLEERSVMVVKQLDKIPGNLAQAFHTMCDEHSPLVPKSLFIFTMEINNTSKQYKSDFERVEKILRNSWSDIDDDAFYPLFTRISSMVLKIEL